MEVTSSTDPTLESTHAENLASSLRRVERQKRSLEEWASTLERTVTGKVDSVLAMAGGRPFPVGR